MQIAFDLNRYSNAVVTRKNEITLSFAHLNIYKATERVSVISAIA